MAALIRISHQIIEKNRGTKTCALLALHQRRTLAREIARNIKKSKTDVDVGELDITLYRRFDKLGLDPIVNETLSPFP